MTPTADLEANNQALTATPGVPSRHHQTLFATAILALITLGLSGSVRVLTDRVTALEALTP